MRWEAGRCNRRLQRPALAGQASAYVRASRVIHGDSVFDPLYGVSALFQTDWPSIR